MGAADSVNQIGAALFGKSRRALLALFFVRPEQSFYLRQIVRMVGGGQGAVQRELAQLVAGGLLTRRRLGSQVYYQADAAGAVFHELKSLMIKTAGLADVLREALAGLAPRIRVAFVHGSMTRGADRADSDVDLMVVGEVTFGEVAMAVQTAQKTIGREVNPMVYPPGEFRQKLQARHHFLAAVMATPKIYLIGDERELKRLGTQRMVGRA
jgi:uncharacterized protein